MPKRKTRSKAGPAPAKSSKPEPESSEASDTHGPSRMGPTVQQQINWLKSYEVQLKEDTRKLRKIIDKMDKLIEIGDMKAKERQVQEAVVSAVAAAGTASGNEDLGAMLQKLNQVFTIEPVSDEEELES